MRTVRQVLMGGALSPRKRKVVMLLGAAWCGLYLTYVFGIAGAIWMGALTRLTRDSADFKLDARSGYSLWPGSLRLSELNFRFKDHNVEVQVEAREARLQVSLWQLSKRTIQIDELQVKDGRYRMPHRVHDGERNRDRPAAFPNIGFERSKVYDSPEPAYRAPPFRILVKSIAGNVLEAWILEYRALGNFAVSGGFELHRDVKVFPSHVIMKDAALYVGARKISDDFDCDLRAELGPFPGASRHVPEVVGGLDAALFAVPFHCAICPSFVCIGQGYRCTWKAALTSTCSLPWSGGS